MRISNEQIRQLQKILKDEFNLSYSDEKAQEAGLAILHFIIAKLKRISKQQLMKVNDDNSME